MYDYAYENGFRTAFMSLNMDNTGNSASIQTNAAMLETIFPRILATFGVSKVYFICHSKGGLDLQDALATPQWIGIANAVITLGTPNNGDALATWLFTTASGQTLGATLGPVSYTHLDVYKRQILQNGYVLFVGQVIVFCGLPAQGAAPRAARCV